MQTRGRELYSRVPTSFYQHLTVPTSSSTPRIDSWLYSSTVTGANFPMQSTSYKVSVHSSEVCSRYLLMPLSPDGNSL